MSSARLFRAKFQSDYKKVRLFMLRTAAYFVPSHKIQVPVTIAHLSDLHGFSQAPGPEKILKAVRRTPPDIIALTGDMVDGRTRDFKPVLELCRRLAGLAPCFFVPGNHEQALASAVYRDFLSEMSASGVTVLNNSRQYLSVHGQNLAVAGLVTPLSTYKERLAEKLLHLEVTDSHLKKALGPCPKNLFTLLLYHNPLRFPVCARWGADLTLAGHVHGGVVRLPLAGGLLSPDVTLFPFWDGGRYVSGHKAMVVSRGLGNNFLRRINNPPEIGIITLTSYQTGTAGWTPADPPKASNQP